jgi:hypothetical protein
MVLVRPPSKVADRPDRDRNVDVPRVQERLPDVERLDCGEPVRMLVHECRELVEEVAARAAGRLHAPGRVERPASGDYGSVDIGGRAFGDGSENLPRG